MHIKGGIIMRKMIYKKKVGTGTYTVLSVCNNPFITEVRVMFEGLDSRTEDTGWRGIPNEHVNSFYKKVDSVLENAC
jgi:hypothetical protein